MKKAITLFLAILLCGSVFSLYITKGSMAITKEWTVIAYLGGDNNLEGSADDILQKMLSVGSTSDVNIIALVDYQTRDDKILEIRPSGMLDITHSVTSDTEFDIGNPAFLKAYLDYIKFNFPAVHYFLTIFDHGSGLAAPASDNNVQGIPAYDSVLTITELADSIPKDMFIDVLFMYACYSGNVETIFELRNKVGILVGSEDESMSRSLLFGLINDAGPINEIVGRLENDPSQNPSTLGKDIVNSYFSWAEFYSLFQDSPKQFTMAAYDLSKTDELVNAINRFSARLQALDSTKWENVNNAILASTYMNDNLNIPSHHDKTWVDLLSFVEHASSEMGDNELTNNGLGVAVALSLVVMDFQRGSERSDCNGIGILLPKDATIFDFYFASYATYKYPDFAFGKTSGWTDFIKNHYAYSAFVPIDLILVLDRSGSMEGSPLASVKDSAIAVVDSLHSNVDRVGVVTFDDIASLNVGLTNDFDFAKSQISIITSGDMTSFGAGLEIAVNEFKTAGADDHAWFIIFMSDGQHNTAPDPDIYVSESKSLKIPIYTIGYGDVDENKLLSIASETGGEYLFSPTAYELQNNFLRFSLTGAGWTPISEFSGVVFEGQTVNAGTFYVSPRTPYTRITLNWPGSDLDLILERPNGETIDLLSDSDVLYSGDTKPESATLVFPEEGTWTIMVYGRIINSPDEPYTTWVSSYTPPEVGVPESILLVGNPKVTGAMGEIIVTSLTPLTLEAYNVGGYSSGADLYYYRIFNDDYDSEWRTLATPSVFKLEGLSDGQYTIEFYNIDKAGNTEDTKKMVVVLDNTPPVGSIRIADGDSSVKTVDVKLELEAFDDMAGLFAMRFSNDGVTWSEWEKFSTSKEWRLDDGYGRKTISVQFEDRLGLITNCDVSVDLSIDPIFFGLIVLIVVVIIIAIYVSRKRLGTSKGLSKSETSLSTAHAMPSSISEDTAKRLEDLEELLKKHLITKEDYEKKRKEIISEL